MFSYFLSPSSTARDTLRGQHGTARVTAQLLGTGVPSPAAVRAPAKATLGPNRPNANLRQIPSEPTAPAGTELRGRTGGDGDTRRPAASPWGSNRRRHRSAFAPPALRNGTAA